MSNKSANSSTGLLRVFLCHSSADKPIVREVNQRLQAEGWIDSWLDEEKILPGQDWTLEIKRAVEQSDAVIVFLSRGSVAREGYLQKEFRSILDEAMEKPENTIFIIPLRIEECRTPSSQHNIQHINYFPKNKRNLAFERVMRALRVRAGSLKGDVSTPDGHSVYAYGDLQFVQVPVGPFFMGTQKRETGYSEADERSQLKIDIPYDYFIGRFPVTVGQYEEFIDWRGLEHEWEKDDKKKLDHPVTCMTWERARDFCKWLNEQCEDELPTRLGIKLVFRPPTEAEWEKAARGENEWDWPWGNEFKKEKCNSLESCNLQTTLVGMFSGAGGDSPFGAADMAGI